MYPPNLKIGEIYKRTYIHDHFGGSRQRGISYSAENPNSPIFLFSQISGKQFGYEDGWDAEGEYYGYSGEGRSGDMKFTAGNLALKEHIAQNRNVLLMTEAEEKGWFKYDADLKLVDWKQEKSKGGDGNNRLALKFRFKKVAC